MKRLLLALLAALLLGVGIAGQQPSVALAGPYVGGFPIPYPLVVPPCNCPDDGAAINRALGTRRPVTLVRGGAYTVTTPIVPPSNAELHLAGATISSAVLTGGPSWSATICAGATGGSPLTLAAQTTAGASSFTVTSISGLVVGQPVYISYLPAGVPNFGQAFTVASVTGSSNPYTVTIADGRTLAWAYPTATTVVLASPTLPTGIRIYGEGATINVTNPSQPRGVQLATCQGCLVQDLTITGSAGWGISYDIGGYHNVMRDVTIDGAIASMLIGVAAEGCEACTYESLRIKGAATGGYFYASIGSTFDKINVSQPGLTSGIQLDGNTSYGSAACTLSNSTVQSGASANKFTAGVAIYDQSSGWIVRDTSVVGVSGDGVELYTQTSGVPDAVTLSGVSASACGGSGIHLVNATNAILNSVRATGNATGIYVTAGASRTQVIGGQLASNTAYGLNVAASIAVLGLSSTNDAIGLYATGGSYNSTLHGVVFTHTTGSGGYDGLYLTNTGRWDLSAVTVDSTGTTGTAILFFPTGTGGSVYCQNCIARGGTGSYGFYSGGAGMYFYYDATSDPSGAATPTGGTAGTPAVGFASLH